MNAPIRLNPTGDAGPSRGSLYLVAGPCSVETEEQIMAAAAGLARHPFHLLRGGVWKPRTRPGTFEGIGPRGLQWLKQAGMAVGRPVATEVAFPEHVEFCLEAGIDVLWIGARTTVNPFAVHELAEALRGVDVPVMVKNPVNPDLDLWIGALERLNRAGVTRLSAIHRGFSSSRRSTYRNLPEWRIPIELRRAVPDLPLLCDPSHLCGRADLIPGVAQEALDLLFDGLMIEVHPDPPSARSDARQQITPDAYGELIGGLVVKSPTSDEGEFQRHIRLLRREIDELDAQIIDILARRMEVVRGIADYKKRFNVSVLQPDRWEQIIKSRKGLGREHHLDEGFILGVYQLIHQEAIRCQEEPPSSPPGEGKDTGGRNH